MDARRLVSVGALAAALAMLAAGCLLDSDKSPVIHERGGTINITVSDGTTPEYSWPGGSVWSVEVARVSEPSEMVWWVTGTGAGWLTKPAAPVFISSPVRHGKVPEGAALERSKEVELVRGAKYRVTVRVSGDWRDSGSWVEFTPQ